ncbi:unnamed protein product [Dovyalis caffra]|uniref:Uncharacterized protein n=1 Tax=Dovyalis caffra TaxID=77055 RepID=A0AAV1SAB4_9ROSI|nr:unnamed protein product [Dovyalis caffra]
MERTSPPRNTKEEEAGSLSCWGRLKYLKFPWTKRRISSNTTTSSRQKSNVGCNITAALMRNNRKPKVPAGGRFRYSPLSYAQNFDDGSWDNDDIHEDDVYPGFSSRFAPPSSRSLEEDK